MDHGEDWLGQDVEDTVEDHLRVGGDDVSTVRKTPGDWVKEPEEREDGGGQGEGRLVTGTEDTSRRSGRSSENPPDVEEGDTSEDEETPLVLGLDETTDKTSDDHDNVEEDKGDDVGKGEAGGEDKGEEQSRGGDEPVDVPNVPKLSEGTGLESHVPELGRDAGVAKVGGHGEVSDRSGGQDHDSKLVEDTLSSGNSGHPDEDDEIGERHDTEDGPEPVGASHGDVLGDIDGRVLLESVVAHVDNVRVLCRRM